MHWDDITGVIWGLYSRGYNGTEKLKLLVCGLDLRD